MRPVHASRWLRSRALVCAALVLHLAGCGTLLYPDRQGQKGGRVDPGIVVLDGVLLFFFIVPGLVAFGIDFYTGAIYLPGGHGHHAQVVPAPGGDLSDAAVRELVARATGVVLPSDVALRAIPCPDTDTLSAWVEQAPDFDAAMLPSSSVMGG
ncbi:MAG TPA: hypothetical protein VMW19_21150 [Myxococcota bacterium]|nr:hypothetical protein [Myxococcota bacterium]